MASGTINAPQSQLIVDSVYRDNISLTTSGTGAYGNYVFDADHSADITKAGYTPIAIAGWQISVASSSGTNASYVMCYGATLSSTTSATMSVRNVGSSSAKIKMTIYILYRKD